jgi:hypothetical protein
MNEMSEQGRPDFFGKNDSRRKGLFKGTVS